MSETLTLPGSIPGLLRRGSPVRHPRWPNVPMAIVCCHTNDRTCVVGYPWPLNGEWADSWPLSMLALDLTDATGRAHAAWWLDAACDRAGTWAGAHMWRLRVELAGVRRFGPWTPGPDGYSCPSLADLNADDLRLLPDGSQWVDAEALRRVVLHIAGVAP